MDSENSTVAICRILNARSIAVVGASASPIKLGYKTLKCLIDGGFQGKLYAVNPKAKNILGVPVYPSVRAIPGEIDLLVILVPAQYVAEVLRQGTEKNALGAIIISSGFREAGFQELEDNLFEVAKSGKIRIIGPNIQGINYVPNNMCAVILPLITKSGPLSIVSQSGSVSATLSEWAESDEIGITGMINLGNQLDLCESDFLEYLAEEKNTKVIMLYLEGPKEGKRFKNILKKVALKKPILLLKPGRTLAGKNAAATHTASIAGNDIVFTFACKQFGVIRTKNTEELYDAGKVLALQGLPGGKRVMVITTSGGVGAMTMDAIAESELEAAVLPQEVIGDLINNISAPEATFSNPMDLPFLENSFWQQVMGILEKYSFMDSVVFAIADAVPGIENTIIKFSQKTKVPVVVSYMGGGKAEMVGKSHLQRSGIPVYQTSERAVKALAALTWYSDFRREHSE